MSLRFSTTGAFGSGEALGGSGEALGSGDACLGSGVDLGSGVSTRASDLLDCTEGGLAFISGVEIGLGSGSGVFDMFEATEEGLFGESIFDGVSFCSGEESVLVREGERSKGPGVAGLNPFS